MNGFEEFALSMGFIFGMTFGLIIGVFGTATAMATAGSAAGIVPLLIGSGLVLLAIFCYYQLFDRKTK